MAKFFIFSSLVFLFSCETYKTSIPSLYTAKLDNGLTLFIMEKDTVPLAYIEIAVKGGGIAQTKENAGLFHLYEHLMFKGNEKFPTAAAVQRAINDLGVTEWNGSTGTEFVNYYFTVPSDLVYQGIEFWSAAIRTPLLNPREFENEKKVVVSEIEGRNADTSAIFHAALQKNLFPEHTHRLDPGGTPETIQNATLAQLLEIKNKYYVPNNTALFIGGDVDHKKIFKMVNEIFGDWQPADDPFATPPPQFDRNPLKQPRYLVQADPKISPSLAAVSVFFRGPDTDYDVQSTYASDVFCELLANPFGEYKNTLLNNQNFGILDPDHISSYYATYRQSGQFVFSATMSKIDVDLPQRIIDFGNHLQKTFSTIATSDVYFTDEQFQMVFQRILDTGMYSRETARDFLSELRFWWASASEDYFFSYASNMQKVTYLDIQNLLNTYLVRKKPLIMVRVHPSVYETGKANFDAMGFSEITAENAFYHTAENEL
ncbi:MAG: insulinase family protein [Spirochaetaceae bacterium]|nr:insulinase family protein [Spirochaetaceae bacterium]